MDQRTHLPTTQRTAPAGSSRVAALAVVGVLLALVWLGASGRTGGPADERADIGPRSTSLLAQALPSASPSSSVTPAPRRPSIRPPRPAWQSSNVAAGMDAFGVAARVENRFYFDFLHEVEAGQLRASLVVPPVHRSRPAELEIFQIWTREGTGAYAHVASYQLAADWLASDSRHVVLIDEVGARAEAGMPRLLRHGYSLSMTAEAIDGHGLLTVDVALHPLPSEAQLDGQPRIWARLVHDGQPLAATNLDGGAASELLSGSLALDGARAPAAHLELLWDGLDGSEPVLLSSLALQPYLPTRDRMRSVVSGIDLPLSGGDGQARWRYRVALTAHGVNDVLLRVEARPSPHEEVDSQAARQRLLHITSGWRDFGQRHAPPAATD